MSTAWVFQFLRPIRYPIMIPPETTLEILAGGDTPCNSLRACDTGKSYGAGTPWTNAEVTWEGFFFGLVFMRCGNFFHKISWDVIEIW